MKFFFDLSRVDGDAAGLLLHAAARYLYARGIGLARSSGDPGCGYTLIFDIDNTYSDERYTLEPFEGGVSVRAADKASLFAAFGRFLEESEFDGRGGFAPPPKRVDFTPKSHLRGIYFATHYYNFYHSAPMWKVYTVIEDLALRGCNLLMTWFDMHHFTSMEDDEAKKLVSRIRSIIKYANRLGIGGAFTMNANEAFADSPEGLRAEYEARGRYFANPHGHYHVELCPSKPGGLEEILAERRAMYEKFADLDIRFVSFWPYDQGGCTCEACEPWGANGFLKILPGFRSLTKEFFPQAKIILSTWYFDLFCRDEWRDFYPRMTDGTLDGVDYVLANFFKSGLPEVFREKGIPEGITFIDFPEISMHSCSPWGGYGASLLARFLDEVDEKSEGLFRGGFPYSEGIFEDCNKYICLARYSGRFSRSADAVRQYVKLNFCVTGDALDELTDAVLKTETALPRKTTRGGRVVLEIPPAEEPLKVEIADTSDIEYCFCVFDKYNSILPEKIKSEWKFRIFYLRALIDREILENDFFPGRSAAAQAALAEISRIWYVNENTGPRVTPPLGR